MTNFFTPHIYENSSALASALAQDIAQRLSEAIASNGSASIAVSGGSTPKQLFAELSHCDIAWNNVTIIMVDERYVAPDDTRSNEKLIREHLLQNNAQTAELISFWQDGKNIDQAEDQLNSVLNARTHNIDITVLGMGLDGHTASFFPGGNNLEAATNPSTDRAIIQMEAEGAGEPRLTLTLPIIVKSNYLVLHIEGDNKREVFDQALTADLSNTPPIRTVIEELNSPIHLYWAP